MKGQKILREPGKVIVVSDYREREVMNHLREMGAAVSAMNLDVGDFICSNRTVVERKDHGDYVSSIIDGRIFDQVERMRKNFERPVLIIEGSSNRKISENAYLASIAKIIVEDGVSLVRTKNPQETAKTIYWMARREQEENKRDVSFKLGKKPADVKRMKEWIVSSLPGVSAVISKRLLDEFGSVEAVMAAEEEELMKVKGVGKSLAKRIRSATSGKY